MPAIEPRVILRREMSMRMSIGSASMTRMTRTALRGAQLKPSWSAVLIGAGLLVGVEVCAAAGDGSGDEVEVCVEGVGDDDGVEEGEGIVVSLSVQVGAGATAAVGSNLTHP